MRNKYKRFDNSILENLETENYSLFLIFIQIM